ncbi:hypothetical protein C8E83_3470 [Frondihabitans australicus]|uniref:Uncharacterized protein n=1 Tax=Frondihabitans australicus TaxID=386892 RepID=A0A495IJW3_9MICO|nr:hypothetical protein C8E83_3470 [Frondihabitans australicus]
MNAGHTLLHRGHASGSGSFSAITAAIARSCWQAQATAELKVWNAFNQSRFPYSLRQCAYTS